MYQIAEDSLFFAEFLKKYLSKLKNKNISYIDIGTGSGILPETAEKFKLKSIEASDIDILSVKYASKRGIKAVKSDLFSNIKGKFDLITFNAPYLQEDKYDRSLDTTGGKKGDETAVKFLKQAKKHLTKSGRIFLLISSLTPISRIKKFNPKISARKKLFFEELLILEFGSI